MLRLELASSDWLARALGGARLAGLAWYFGQYLDKAAMEMRQTKRRKICIAIKSGLCIDANYLSRLSAVRNVFVKHKSRILIPPRRLRSDPRSSRRGSREGSSSLSPTSESPQASSIGQDKTARYVALWAIQRPRLRWILLPIAARPADAADQQCLWPDPG